MARPATSAGSSVTFPSWARASWLASCLISWPFLRSAVREVGRLGVPIRLMVGLHLFKHIEGLSDEAVCAGWERDPYMQYFCGEEYF